MVAIENTELEDEFSDFSFKNDYEIVEQFVQKYCRQKNDYSEIFDHEEDDDDGLFDCKHLKY